PSRPRSWRGPRSRSRTVRSGPARRGSRRRRRRGPRARVSYAQRRAPAAAGEERRRRMTRGDPSDEAARADGGHEESARLLIGPESDQEALRRLLRARSDPRRLAAELPRGEAPEGAEAGLVLLSLFCVGCLAAGLAMPFALAGPAVGVAVGVGGTALYLAVRPVVKRFGVLS